MSIFNSCMNSEGVDSKLAIETDELRNALEEGDMHLWEYEEAINILESAATERIMELVLEGVEEE